MPQTPTATIRIGTAEGAARYGDEVVGIAFAAADARAAPLLHLCDLPPGTNVMGQLVNGYLFESPEGVLFTLTVTGVSPAARAKAEADG